MVLWFNYQGFAIAVGGLHFSVELEGFQRHVVADEADDDGVPHRGGGAWKSVQKMACQVRLPLLAQFA